jgi:PAS domain S-box-containing protein
MKPVHDTATYARRRTDSAGIDGEIGINACRDSEKTNAQLMVMRNLASPQQDAGMAGRQNDYLAVIADAAPVLIAYIDKEERFRFVNAACEVWFGAPKTHIIGRPADEWLGDGFEAMRPHIRRALLGESASYECSVRSRQGERRVVGVHTPDLDASGAVRGLSCVIMDISHRPFVSGRSEQGGETGKDIDVPPVFIARCDTDYRVSFVNHACTNRLGSCAEQFKGKRLPEALPADMFAKIRPYLDTALTGKAQEHEIRISASGDGDYVMHAMYIPERNDNGEVTGLIAAISDVTQLRMTEERLHRHEREFKTLVENSPDIISRIDRQMRHLYVNPAMSAIGGFEPSAYIGKTKADLGLPESVVSAWDKAVQAVFDTGVEQRFDFDHMIDGRMRYFSARTIPEADRNGYIESVLAIAYDVTERATMAKERDDLLARERSARIQAETAARARDEFLAIVSHELRAPLNGIQSWAHVLESYVKESTAAPLAQRALHGIKTGIGQQVRLIEDLLDVTRMISGKLRLVKQPVALLPALEAAVENVRGAAAARRIAVVCDYRITSEQIDGDADRVQQIFWNLLSNAIKFTPENGHVWLTATHTGDEICVAVRDDGAGVSPEFLPLLFNRFTQKDTSTTRNHSGLGLGLFLVRHLVELHSGRVHAESPGEGKGTTFSVHLPLRVAHDKYMSGPPAEETESAVPLPSLADLRILLVDDQEEARESLTVVLSNAGANVFAASGAAEALQWLPQLAPSEFPEVLICDIAMPGEDGYSVLRKLRAWKTKDNRMPLQRMPALALTAFAHREDRIRALAAGFQMHVTKPVAPEELIIVIAAMTARD